MYKTITEFIKDWETEKDLTLKIFRSLRNEALDTRPYPEGRTLGRIAWHITTSVSEMGKVAGMEVTSLDENEHYPPCESIIAAYENVAAELAQCISLWSDEKLNEEILAYGEKWTRTFTLQVLVRHQIHHRAQMTVLMRLAGLRVPGIYGPSKEEWAELNMVPIE